MPPTIFPTAHILIIDDQEANVRVLERILQQAGYQQVTTTTDSRQVLDLFTAIRPDLILLDLHMPHLDGFAVLDALTPCIAEDSYLPTMMLTADVTPAVKQQALAKGVRDFLTKPFDAIEVVLRCRNLLETRLLHLQLQKRNDQLDEQVQIRTAQLEQAQADVVARLAR